MPCEDSSTCSRNCDCDPVAEGSEPPSADTPFKWCERCGHHRDDHGTPDRHCVWTLCACQRLSGGPFGFEVKEPREPATKGDFLRCWCTHFQMNHRPFSKGGCRNCACETFRLKPESLVLKDGENLTDALDRGLDEEPPLTPEEEEEAGDWQCANETGCYRQHTNDCQHGCRWAADELSREANEMEPPPPQPDRRPPYAVTYSVQGHLYEVALPGDATVRAVDGALVIQHHLGPVAGIVSVLPIINEESA